MTEFLLGVAAALLAGMFWVIVGVAWGRRIGRDEMRQEYARAEVHARARRRKEREAARLLDPHATQPMPVLPARDGDATTVLGRIFDEGGR